MRLLLVILLMTLLGWNIHSFAQEFEVRSFEADPTDLAARRFPRTTVNDEPAALIKVMTNIEGLNFDSNLGIVDVDRKEDEYWVYVPPRERRIRLMAQGFLSLDLNMPELAQSNVVYHLIVTAKGLPETLNVIPVNIIVEGHDDAVLFVNEEEYPVNRTISLPRGENAIRIEKQGYRTIEKNIDVNVENTLFRFTLEGINEERFQIIEGQQTQQTLSRLFKQEKYSFLHLSFTQMNLNTVNYSRNIDGSMGVNAGINYFGNYWGANASIGYNSLILKQTARAEFGFKNIGVINYYACIGPKLRFSVFEIFVMAGYEGSRISYGGDTNWQGGVFSGDLILNYGGMILPHNWRFGFRYSGNIALGLLDSYPPFSRQEFGLIYKF